MSKWIKIEGEKNSWKHIGKKISEISENSRYVYNFPHQYMDEVSGYTAFSQTQIKELYIKQNITL